MKTSASRFLSGLWKGMFSDYGIKALSFAVLGLHLCSINTIEEVHPLPVSHPRRPRLTGFIPNACLVI